MRAAAARVRWFVSLMHRLRVLVVCLALQTGVFLGVPMLPDQIRELMKQMNRPALAHVLPADHHSEDDT